MPGTRAVTRLVLAGERSPCAGCDEPIKFEGQSPKLRQHQVIANVYEGGRWNRVEHWHARCYDGRHGEAGDLKLKELARERQAVPDVATRRRLVRELTDEGFRAPAIAERLGIPVHMVHDARRYR